MSGERATEALLVLGLSTAGRPEQRRNIIRGALGLRIGRQ